MKKYVILISSYFMSIAIYGQSIDEVRSQNNSEIKELKKDYFEYLQKNQDARIFSITEERKSYTYKKLENRRQHVSENYKKDSATREHLNIKKQHFISKKRSKYNDSIANAIGFRRVSKAISDREKKRKAQELEAANKREAFYRSQTMSLKKDNCKNDLKSRLKSRHATLKKKYIIKE